MAFLASLFGNPEEKLLKSWKPLIGRINAFEPSLENLSPTELKAKTVEFKIRIGKGEKLDDLLPEAYAVVRDAAWMGEIYNYLGLSVGVLNHAESFLYDPAHSEKDEERDELGSFHVVH